MGKWSLILSCFYAAAFGHATGVRAQPTGFGEAHDRYMSARCLEILPEDGFLRVRSIDGTIQRLPCVALLEAPLKDLDRLRSKRDSVYVRNLGRIRAKVPQVMSAKYYRVIAPQFNPSGLPLDPHETVFLEADAECYQELRLFWILTRIANLGTVGRQATDSFAFYLAEDDIPFMLIVNHVGSDPDHPISGWSIHIPRKLLWAEAMSDELLVFMLLHEMGHALQVPESELNADWWAMNIGLPGFYGQERAANLRDGLADSFKEYCRSVYTSSTYAHSSCTRDSVDFYPNLECRLRGIRGPDWIGEDGERIQSYTDLDECWSQGIMCGPKGDNKNVVGTCCTDKPCPECPPSRSTNNVLPGVVRITDILDSTLDSLSFISHLGKLGICSIKPELCAMSDTQRRTWLSDNIPSFDRRERRIEKLLMESVIRTRYLNERILSK